MPTESVPITPPQAQALPAVVLKSGRDKSVRAHHPRLFSGAIKLTEGRPKDGNVVDVRTNNGEWLARGIINQQAQIAVRLLSWDPTESIDDQFWYKRTARAVKLRRRDPLLSHTNARRLVFGESDGLPGVIADDYAGHIVLQLSTLAAANARASILDALVQCAGALSVTERNDEERMRHEHLRDNAGVLYGYAPQEPVEITENGLHFLVDVNTGQKTGFYLDQRENRARLARYCADTTVLNVFSYTGAFAVATAAHGAARVINIDSSPDALRMAEANARLNSGTPCLYEYVAAEAFAELRRRRAAGEQYDIVILDPPKFAHSTEQIDRAARAYKDLNRVGIGLVKAGGILAAFSCSGVIDAALFQKVMFSAAVEAGRDVQIVEKLSQASDHPILLSFPESEYLKGLLCRVL
ncbi:MAG: class I SAM-dependent rRNA methyltransferase [Chloroflexi bacterium]|nr:class I SAM-dependent rRNA methyltransferase [Chloroflexota bacterium]MCL5274036.1 class I SAM-dependent rRNA methyltransferase [Chloroflexota bacterium]